MSEGSGGACRGSRGGGGGGAGRGRREGRREDVHVSTARDTACFCSTFEKKILARFAEDSAEQKQKKRVEVEGGADLPLLWCSCIPTAGA